MARSKRINLLASLTKGYDTVLDIGTDHGLVLKKAFDQGFIKKAIAADIKESPLLAAKKNLAGYNVDFVLSDGFNNIKQSFDLAIIAGMGAYTIEDIMSHAPLHDAYFVLQANDRHAYLRTYLTTHGYMITDEYIVFDGFYYVIIVFKKGHMTCSDKDAYLGPILQHKNEAKPYYEYKLKTLINIIDHVDAVKKKTLNTKIEYLKSVL